LNINVLFRYNYYCIDKIFMQAWEGRAYDYGMDNLKSMGFPVDDLKFDPDLVVHDCVPHP